MKEILDSAGYNSAFSFLTITEEKLPELEDYIEKNCRNTADKFDTYKTTKPFSFLPGHRDLILGIKSELTKLQEKQSENKRQKLSKSNKSQVLEEIDVKTSLIKQVNVFSSGLNLKIDWSNSIDAFEFEKTSNSAFASCKVSCPLCGATYILRFDRHWKTSNICKHIRTHADRGEKTTQIHQTKNKNMDKNANVSATASATVIRSEGKINANKNTCDEITIDLESNNLSHDFFDNMIVESHSGDEADLEAEDER